MRGEDPARAGEPRVRDAQALPLCVDLDGTLVATDLFYESFASFLRHAAGSAWRVPRWLAAGRPVLKRELAARARVDASTLPYREEVVRYLEQERAKGRPVVLATASHRGLAEAVARHAGVFDRVIATDAGPNLKGLRKKAALDEAFGAGGYEYLGDSGADLAVWNGAAAASCVGCSPRRLAQIARITRVVRTFAVPRPGPSAWLRAVRPVALARNAFVFAPLLLGDAWALLPELLVAFACLVALSASLHVLDDLVDLAPDRAAPQTRARPFADGTLRISTGLAVAAALAAAALGAAALALPGRFAALLLGVAGLGLAGILFGHRVPALAGPARWGLDALRLASGFVLRAG